MGKLNSPAFLLRFTCNKKSAWMMPKETEKTNAVGFRSEPIPQEYQCGIDHFHPIPGKY